MAAIDLNICFVRWYTGLGTMTADKVERLDRAAGAQKMCSAPRYYAAGTSCGRPRKKLRWQLVICEPARVTQAK